MLTKILKVFSWMFVKLIGRPSIPEEKKKKAWQLFKELFSILCEKGSEGLAKGFAEEFKDKF